MQHNGEELPVLIGQAGPLDGQRWVIRGKMVVGRDADCDIVVADRQVSRRHASFTPSTDGITLKDLKSKNGTHCNGQRLQDPAKLEDGDVIQIALAQQFVYLSSDATVPLEVGQLAEVGQSEGRLRLDKRSRRVWIHDQELAPPLSVAQFILLEMLYQSQGRVVSRQDLIEGVWGEEGAYEVSNQALDALIRRLRDRLAALDPTHNYIVTVRGHGLRLENPSD